ncbi:protein-disulfide reductase DsbD [Pusillimonas sp. ANT_WB101]|uniref:protein-disulfide reductase DsbD n=1 Tax=Pusillimonas sp. ANT_WB101 TaxID=2597356 RepID=UPI0011EEF10A|nr:protein-disulfide reductase DsbD [Pusillimonas sp. ANT_WB101]KAA0891091.1 protein-disulfide reductase DsbD [Pusillimonas sp. ANT_WB101]
MLYFARSDNAAFGRRVSLRACLAAFFIVIVSLMAFHSAMAEEDFLDPEQAFVFSAATQKPHELSVHFKIAPKYYMYRSRFEFAVDDGTDASVLGQPVFPQGQVKYDPTFDENMEVYHDQITIRVPLQAGAAQAFKVSITGQGCADAGLCYPPDTRQITLSPIDGGYAAAGKGVVARVPDPAPQAGVSGGASKGTGAGTNGGVASGAPGGQLSSALNLGDAGFATYLSHAGLLEIVGLSLLLGLLLSFTPCVLPMVPILLAILMGRSGPSSETTQPGRAGSASTRVPLTRKRGLALAAVFVLGMSLVYTALGIAAGLVGASLAGWLQTPWVLGVFAFLLALLALAMFDVYTLQAPTGMQSALNQRLSRIPGGHYGGVFIMGMLSALIVGPCVAAPLAGVLLFISQTGDVVLGGTALFALAWGQGLLLLAVGASSGMLMPKAGPWMQGIKHIFGILLLATAWWMVNSVVPDWLSILGWALLALWAAVMLGAFGAINQAADAGVGAGLRKALGLALAAWALILLVGLAAGSRDMLRPLAVLTASSGSGFAGSGQLADSPTRFVRVGSSEELDQLLATADRPVMLDFYADWCVSCIEMERFTFSDPAVAQQMSRMLLVQADVTDNTPQDRALLKRFKLFGPPGIIFFDQQGGELDSARVVGFMNAEKFGIVLGRVLGQ